MSIFSNCNITKKHGLFFILLILLTCFLAGCTTRPGIFRSIPKEDISSEMYQESIAFNSATNNQRLVNFLYKASLGQPLTIGFFGGSITEGYATSDPALAYANRVFSFFEKSFPNTDFTYINAGIAGTGSGIGVHRVNDDLLQYKPDLVIVDAAVNDNNTEHYQETYENLLRQILLSDSEPAVILLFMVEENGNCATQVESVVGQQYQLPMINYGAAIQYAISNGDFAWEDIADDYVHPLDRGHAIICGLITTYINDVYKEHSNFWGKISEDTLNSMDIINYSDIPYITKNSYNNGKILDFKKIQPVSYGNFLPYKNNEAFPNALSLNYSDNTDVSSGEDLTFTVNAANIGLILQSPELEKAGFFDVYIDGEPHSIFSYQGFLMCDVDIYNSNEVAEHTVTIRPNPDYPDAEIVILAVLTSE